MNKDEINEYIEDLLTVACCPGHDYSCKQVYKYVKQLQSNWNILREWLEDKQNLVCGCGITPEYIYAYEDVLDKMDELESSDNK